MVHDGIIKMETCVVELDLVEICKKKIKLYSLLKILIFCNILIDFAAVQMYLSCKPSAWWSTKKQHDTDIYLNCSLVKNPH